MPNANTPKIDLSRLPNAGDHFTGRLNEIKLLNDAWNNPNIHIVTLVAGGGVGKTALIGEWLHQLKVRGYAGATHLYVWSFYSQGTGEDRQASTDLFFHDALRWFGIDPTPQSPYERGRALARIIRETRAVLVLDGLEPLQYPPGPMGGELKDSALKILFKELAFDQPGLCILTTRIAVRELERFEEKGVLSHNLENLDPVTGATFLLNLGVKGLDKELKAAAVEYKGHALALKLLGKYLVAVYHGDIRQRDRVVKLSGEESEGEHAQKVMEAYVRWFSEKGDYAPELTLLLLMGLFDRPVPLATLEELLEDAGCKNFTASLRNLSREKQAYTLQYLLELGLIMADETEEGELPVHLKGFSGWNHFDVHPLVREYFGEKFRQLYLEEWRLAHNALYEYFKGLPEKLYGKYLPDTLEEMEPLFLAVGP